MNYFKMNKMKLLIALAVLFGLFQICKFFIIRIVNIGLPNGKIVFSSGLRGSNEIYLMNLNGTNLRRLTKNSLFGPTYNTWIADYRASFSYDGKTIIFDSDRDDKMLRIKKNYYSRNIISEESLPTFQEIYMIKKNEKNPIRLTHDQVGGFSPIFSPDDKNVLFRSIFSYKDSFNEELRVIYLNGGSRRVLAQGKGVALSAKFSVDSKKVFFIFRGDLYLIDIYGKTLNRLTNFNFKNIDKPDDVEEISFICNFALSPDGREITFITRERKVYKFNFYSMNVDGSGMQEIASLTNTGKLLYVATIDNLIYSPDGQKIAFISDFGSKSFYVLDKNYKFNFIRNLNRIDSGIENIENDQFIFTPDSKYIIFVAAFPYGLFNEQLVWVKSIIYEIYWKIKYFLTRRISGFYDNKYICSMNLETGNLRRIARLLISSQFGRDFIYWEK